MHSFNRCLMHCVFSTKGRVPALTEIRGRLWPYLGGIARDHGMKALAIGGVADHVHLLLSLAALYESWAIPLAVMMDFALGALGVLFFTRLRGFDNGIYFKIGLLTIMGLSAKNAILVIEFAKEDFDRGKSLVDSALHAVRQRLRPIRMTSLAFGLGVLPLAISAGAGSGGQNAIGTGIVGGTVTTTVLGLFFVPLYFVAVLGLFRVKPTHPPDEPGQPPQEAPKKGQPKASAPAQPERELAHV